MADPSPPTLHVVTTAKGLRKLTDHIPPSATISVTPFDFNEDLLLVQVADAPVYEPNSIMDLMAKANIPCLCGRSESSAETPGLVYCEKGSALAESRGTITVGVPTLRVRPDGTREFAAAWATQLWIQKALAILKPAAAAVTPHGHLLMVPAPDQTVATLQQQAEKAGLQRIAIRLPVAAAFVARLMFAPGSDTGEIAKWQRAIVAQAATQGLRPIGLWSITGPGERTVQLLLDAGTQPVERPQTFRVGAEAAVSICRKGEKNPWSALPITPAPTQVAVTTPAQRALGPMPRSLAAAAARAAVAAAVAAADATAATAVGAPTPVGTPPVADATAATAATRDHGAAAESSPPTVAGPVADTTNSVADGHVAPGGRRTLIIHDDDADVVPAAAAAAVAAAATDVAVMTSPVVDVGAAGNTTPEDRMLELLMLVRQRAGKDVGLLVTEPADDEMYEMCVVMNNWEVTDDVMKKLEILRNVPGPRWPRLRTFQCTQ